MDTGVLTVYTTDTATFDPTTRTWTEYNMRITFSDPHSDEATSTVEDTFKVIVKNHCTENVLTLTSDLANVLYYIDDA